MPMNRRNTKVMHRRLMADIDLVVRLHKRGDDQRQGTVRALILYQCRRSRIGKTGETFQGDMVSDHRVVWHIPVVELNRVGVQYLNALDRIEEIRGPGAVPGRFWQPEGSTDLDLKLFENYYDIYCLRVDPPDLFLQSVP